jgi:hypothetical protein
MSADSVYQYGIYAILDVSLIGAPQRERVSRGTRSKTHREIAVTLAVSHWGDPVDDTPPGDTKRNLPPTLRATRCPDSSSDHD